MSPNLKPSPKLTPERVQVFAEAIVRGESQSDAYREMCPSSKNWKDRTVHTKASIWANQDEVLGKVQELREAASERNNITVDSIVQELAKIGFSNMADYMKPDSDGTPRLDFSSLTREQAAALTEVTVDTHHLHGDDSEGYVEKIKFKLADKRAALVDLGKHLGMFTKKLELSGPEGEPIQIAEDERVKKLTALLNRAKARQKAEGKKK